MRSITALAVFATFTLFAGCEQSPITQPDAGELVFDAPLDIEGDPDGGDCPNVYWNSQETLDDGTTTITWSSSLGGFDYGLGTDYAAAVTWSVDGADATLNPQTGMRPRGNTWTPRGRDSAEGDLVTADPPFTINMSEMHSSSEDTDGDGVDDWLGEIGNGHFWVVLDIDGMNRPVKLGVNIHLEDPAEGFATRCPNG